MSECRGLGSLPGGEPEGRTKMSRGAVESASRGTPARRACQPRGQQPGHSLRAGGPAQGSGPTKAPGPPLPASFAWVTRPRPSALGDLTRQLPPLPPPQMFSLPFLLPANSGNHKAFPQSRSSWGAGAAPAPPPTDASFRTPGAAPAASLLCVRPSVALLGLHLPPNPREIKQ